MNSQSLFKYQARDFLPLQVAYRSEIEAYGSEAKQFTVTDIIKETGVIQYMFQTAPNAPFQCLPIENGPLIPLLRVFHPDRIKEMATKLSLIDKEMEAGQHENGYLRECFTFLIHALGVEDQTCEEFVAAHTDALIKTLKLDTTFVATGQAFDIDNLDQYKKEAIESHDPLDEELFSIINEGLELGQKVAAFVPKLLQAETPTNGLNGAPRNSMGGAVSPAKTDRDWLLNHDNSDTLLAVTKVPTLKPILITKVDKESETVHTSAQETYRWNEIAQLTAVRKNQQLETAEA